MYLKEKENKQKNTIHLLTPTKSTFQIQQPIAPNTHFRSALNSSYLIYQTHQKSKESPLKIKHVSKHGMLIKQIYVLGQEIDQVIMFNNFEAIIISHQLDLKQFCTRFVITRWNLVYDSTLIKYDFELGHFVAVFAFKKTKRFAVCTKIQQANIVFKIRYYRYVNYGFQDEMKTARFCILNSTSFEFKDVRVFQLNQVSKIGLIRIRPISTDLKEFQLQTFSIGQGYQRYSLSERPISNIFREKYGPKGYQFYISSYRMNKMVKEYNKIFEIKDLYQIKPKIFYVDFGYCESIFDFKNNSFCQRLGKTQEQSKLSKKFRDSFEKYTPSYYFNFLNGYNSYIGQKLHPQPELQQKNTYKYLNSILEQTSQTYYKMKGYKKIKFLTFDLVQYQTNFMYTFLLEEFVQKCDEDLISLVVEMLMV